MSEPMLDALRKLMTTVAEEYTEAERAYFRPGTAPSADARNAWFQARGAWDAIVRAMDAAGVACRAGKT